MPPAGDGQVKTPPPLIAAPRGELGRSDALILDQLLRHACDSTGLALTKAMDLESPHAGEYFHMFALSISSQFAA